jgi:hypothetical protein
VNRTRLNIRWVTRKLHKAGETDWLEEEILDAMNATERDILGRQGKKTRDTLTMFSQAAYDAAVIAKDAAQSDYDDDPSPTTLAALNAAIVALDIAAVGIDGIYAYTGTIFELERPTSWPNPLTLINDVIDFLRIVYVNQSGAQPSHVLSWDKQLRFFPIPTEGEEVGVWKLVGQDEEMDDDEGDPTLPVVWDFALRYGTLAKMIGGDWTTMYQIEVDFQAQTAIQETGKPHLIDHSSRRLGF